MVEIIGSLERNAVEEEQQVQVWRIPAFSETLARQRAKGNGRLKGMNSVSVESSEKVASGQAPGRAIYEVTITAPR